MENVLNAPRLAPLLAGAKSLYVSGCAAEIQILPDILKKHRVQNATITGVFSPLINQRSYVDAAAGLRVRTFLLTRALKADLAEGHVDYCQWRYSMINRWLSQPGRFDTAIVMLSPPDASGQCSLGVQGDFLPSFYNHIPNIIGFINPHMPYTAGHATIAYSSLAAAIDYDAPLATMTIRKADATSAAIAETIARLTPDDATIQLGTGQIPSEVLARLAGHRRLRVHTGVVDDHILTLEESGALDRDRPIVTGTAVGAARLYQALADRKRFEVRPVSFTHDAGVIAAIPRFTAVNSVLQVDLLGQVSGEAIDGKIAASPGGLPDFVRASQNSDGGQSIIAVRARGEASKASGVTAIIDDPGIVTCGASDAHIIVTEFGVADVRGMTLDERAEAIIAIAAPENRADLTAQWDGVRRRLFSRNVADPLFAARR